MGVNFLDSFSKRATLMFMLEILLLAPLLLAEPTDTSSERRAGHIVPFKHEQLDKPVKLSCGLIVFEWRGSKPDFDRVGKWCDKAVKAFPKFIERKFNLKLKTSSYFEYSFSFIPFGSDYRDLNDIEYRFDYRKVKVYGHTNKLYDWSFVLSDTSHIEFNSTVVHEMYHAMVDYYSLGNIQNQIVEEKSAVEFERWVK